MVAKKESSRQSSKRTTRKSARATKVVKASATKTSVKPTKKKSSPKSVLSGADLEMFRRMLIEKRRSLVGDMNGMEAEAFRANRQDRSGDLSNIPIHPADIGSDNYEQEFTIGLLESERVLLAEINDALTRLEEGTYGICLGTSEPIDKARLKARPWAKYCIEYARLLEKGLVRPPEDDPDEPEDDDDEDHEPVDEESAPEERVVEEEAEE